MGDYDFGYTVFFRIAAVVFGILSLLAGYGIYRFFFT